MVRYGSRFVITARDWQSARAALDVAARELSGLNLRLNQSKTRIASFDQGVELFGYRYHESKIAAEPATRPSSWRSGLPGEFKTTVGKVVPSASRFGQKVKERIGAGVGQIKNIFRRPEVETRRKAFDPS